jgi:4'-phosphopantetheinyl transferase
MIWRIKEIVPADAKDRTRMGEDFARQLLGEYSGQPADSFFIARTAQGKPYAENCALEFNLSHSGKWLVCAVGDQPLGVDIEAIKPRNLRIAERFFTQREQEFLAPDQEDALLRFLQIWTAKEAYFKALGTGITDLKSVCYFDLLPHLQQMVTKDYVLTIYQK